MATGSWPPAANKRCARCGFMSTIKAYFAEQAGTTLCSRCLDAADASLRLDEPTRRHDVGRRPSTAVQSKPAERVSTGRGNKVTQIDHRRESGRKKGKGGMSQAQSDSYTVRFQGTDDTDTVASGASLKLGARLKSGEGKAQKQWVVYALNHAEKTCAVRPMRAKAILARDAEYTPVEEQAARHEIELVEGVVEITEAPESSPSAKEPERQEPEPTSAVEDFEAALVEAYEAGGGEDAVAQLEEALDDITQRTQALQTKLDTLNRTMGA